MTIKSITAPAAALACARMGFRLIPLRPGTKEPATAHGSKDASSNLDQIRHWLESIPGANWGIVPGPSSGPVGMMFMDIDAHHDGVETMKALVGKHGPLPRGPMTQTPNGGYHLPFAYVDGLTQGNDKLGKGIDIKTTSGYLILPPSYWDGVKKGELVKPGGGSYRWVRSLLGGNLPRLPEWAIKKLTPKRTIQRSGLRTTYEGTLEQAQRVIDGIPPDDYETWIKVGMGLNHDFGDEAFAMWDQWSQGSTKYNQHESLATWRSFRRKSGIGFGTVVRMARENGVDTHEIYKRKQGIN